MILFLLIALFFALLLLTAFSLLLIFSVFHQKIGHSKEPKKRKPFFAYKKTKRPERQKQSKKQKKSVIATPIQQIPGTDATTPLTEVSQTQEEWIDFHDIPAFSQQPNQEQEAWVNYDDVAACSAEPSRQKGCFKSFLCGIKTRMTQAQNEAQARAIQREERRIQEAIELSDLDETLEEMPEDFSDKLRYWWRNHAGFRIGISAIAVLLVILLMVSAFHTREKVNTQYDLGAVGAENGMLKSEEEKETQKQGEETEKQGEETKIHEIVTSQLMDFRKTLDGNLAPVDVKADSLESLPNMAEIVETVQRSTGQTTETYPGSHTTKQPAGSIATISIPSINLKNAPVMGSVALSDLAKGTGHFENTPLLDGNVGIAGHNNTHFKYLANVAMGAKIQYNINGVTRTYEVTDMRAISDRDWGVFTDYGDNRLTLITCEHAVPDRRIAVTAIQVGADQTISNHTTNTQNHSKPRPAVPNTGYYHEDSGAYHDEGYTDFVGTFTGEN